MWRLFRIQAKGVILDYVNRCCRWQENWDVKIPRRRIQRTECPLVQKFSSTVTRGLHLKRDVPNFKMVRRDLIPAGGGCRPNTRIFLVRRPVPWTTSLSRMSKVSSLKLEVWCGMQQRVLARVRPLVVAVPSESPQFQHQMPICSKSQKAVISRDVGKLIEKECTWEIWSCRYFSPLSIILLRAKLAPNNFRAFLMLFCNLREFQEMNGLGCTKWLNEAFSCIKKIFPTGLTHLSPGVRLQPVYWLLNAFKSFLTHCHLLGLVPDVCPMTHWLSHQLFQGL